MHPAKCRLITECPEEVSLPGVAGSGPALGLLCCERLNIWISGVGAVPGIPHTDSRCFVWALLVLTDPLGMGLALFPFHRGAR